MTKEDQNENHNESLEELVTHNSDHEPEDSPSPEIKRLSNIKRNDFSSEEIQEFNADDYFKAFGSSNPTFYTFNKLSGPNSVKRGIR